MADPIDGKELARLRALLAKVMQGERRFEGGRVTYRSNPEGGARTVVIRSGDAPELELHVAAVNALPALLDAAEAREGLAFVPIAGEQRSLRAMAADGAIYGAWWFDGTWRFRQMGCIETFGAPTESEAIEAAQAHDRARRGGK